MSSINSVKNLQVLYFRRINKKIKKLKKDKKNVGLHWHLHILLALVIINQ